VALVLGLVMVAVAMLAGTVTVQAGQHDCGSAVSAHAPTGEFTRQGPESAVEDQCDRKINGRRVLVAVVGIVGLAIALGGAYDHERGDRRSP
jgi:hypothetical protein